MVVECKRLRYTSSAATTMRAVTKRCGDGSSSGSCYGSDDDNKSGEEDAVGAFPSHPKSNPIFQKDHSFIVRFICISLESSRERFCLVQVTNK